MWAFVRAHRSRPALRVSFRGTVSTTAFSEPMTPAQPIFALSNKRIWIAGHRGMVGQALLRRLAPENCEVLMVGREDLVLRGQDNVRRWIDDARPDAVIAAAATVGGILANATRPAEFLYDNLSIGLGII